MSVRFSCVLRPVRLMAGSGSVQRCLVGSRMGFVCQVVPLLSAAVRHHANLWTAPNACLKRFDSEESDHTTVCLRDISAQLMLIGGSPGQGFRIIRSNIFGFHGISVFGSPFRGGRQLLASAGFDACVSSGARGALDTVYRRIEVSVHDAGSAAADTPQPVHAISSGLLTNIK